MRLCLLLATLLLPIAFAPSAAAVDVCDAYGLCLPDVDDLVTECGVDALAVRVDHCEPQIETCEFTYMGGSPGGPLGNLRRECHAYLALA